MGTFYLQTDIEQFTINPSCRFFKNKLSLTGSLGIQRDNLYQKSAGNSHRTIGLAGLSYNANEVWGIDIQYSNFGISQQLLTKYVNPNPNQPLYDSVRIDQVSRSVTLSPHIILINPNAINTIAGSFSYQDLTDRNTTTSPNNNFNSSIAILTHTIAFLRSKWQLSQSATYLNTKLSTGSAGNIGYTLSASKNLEKKKIALTGNLSYYVNLVGGSGTGHTINASVGAGIHVGQHQSIHAGGGTIATSNNGSNGAISNHSTQLTTYLRYNISF
jgi:outer membrane protein W